MYYKYILLLLTLLMISPLASSISANSTDIIISRGDGIYYTENAPRDAGLNAWIWVFTSTRDNIDPKYDRYFGIPIVVDTAGNYRVDIPYSNISELRAGTYDILIQFEGKNNIRELYYDKNTTEIVSIYKDIKNVYIGGSVQSSFAEGKLLEMLTNKSNGLPDDQYVIKNLVIQDPYIKLDDVYPMEQYTNVIKIKGHTNLNAKHWIYIYYDEDESQKRGVMVEEGEIPGDNTFEYELSIPAQQMSTGQHFVTVKSDLGIYTTGSFTIGVQTTPTVQATPTPYKYIYKTSGGQDLQQTVVPTPTPRTVYVTVLQTPPPAQIIYITPAPTPVPPSLVDTTTKSVSDNILSVVGLIILVAGVIAIQLKKRKKSVAPTEVTPNVTEYKLYEEDIDEEPEREERAPPKKPKKPKALIESDFEL
jgi:hypothetical protein